LEIVGHGRYTVLKPILVCQQNYFDRNVGK